MNFAGPELLPRVRRSPLEPLNTIPVGLPDVALAAGGMLTTSDCGTPAPLYKVDTPDPLSAIQRTERIERDAPGVHQVPIGVGGRDNPVRNQFLLVAIPGVGARHRRCCTVPWPLSAPSPVHRPSCYSSLDLHSLPRSSARSRRQNAGRGDVRPIGVPTPAFPELHPVYSQSGRIRFKSKRSCTARRPHRACILRPCMVNGPIRAWRVRWRHRPQKY